MHHLIAWTGSNPGATNNFDLTAVTDTIVGTRNGHFIFTDPLRIAYLFAQSTLITDARLLSPTFAAVNSDGFRIAGFQRKAGVGGTPTLADRYIANPIALPTNEEIQGQASKSAAGAEQQWVLASIVTPGWNRNIDTGPQMMMEATTASFTPAANVWSGAQNIVMNANPRGGVYAVVGASLQQAADTLAFRMIFPRQGSYNGRFYRPGWIAQNAIGDFEDVITQVDRYHLGVWGYFHTFELPMVEVFTPISAAMTPVLRMWTIYLGGDDTLLNQKVASLR